MSYFGQGQNGGQRGGGGSAPQQATLLTGPQLFVNSNQLQLSGGQNFTFPSQEGTQVSHSQLQLNGGTSLLLQPPVNFVTEQLGVGIGQLITQAGNIMMSNVLQLPEGQQSGGGAQNKQRVFTGTVTKIHDNFGFIDEEVFFQMGVVKGPILPKEGDRVLVEADFNPSMPFKWNATRVQIVNMGGGSSASSQSQSYYTTSKPVPPPPSLSSSRQPQSMNPHSMYSSGNNRSQSHGMSDGMMSGGGGGGGRRPTSSQLNNPHMLTESSMLLPPLMSKMDGRREKGERDRIRERSRSTDRSRDRDRRERSRERERRRSKSRERRVRRSPSPIKRRSRERERVREREKTPERIREKSPKRVVERIKRSRSRDTIKSSEGAKASSDSRRSPSPRRKVMGKSNGRYLLDPPRFSLDVLDVNAFDVKQRYKNLYIPSDFFLAKACWLDAFPINRPFKFPLNSSLVHIFGRRVERIELDAPELEAIQERYKQVPNVLRPPDSSSTFSVKVMLLSIPGAEVIFRKSGFVLETESKDDDKKGDPNVFQTLNRILSFVVGVKTGKHDIAALGGSWSPSLDGLDPQSNPKVLINTAIRCTKALTSIDLTRCKSWYRFMEIYYRRINGNLETVVYFLPDLSSALPSPKEWTIIGRTYRQALHGPDKTTTTTTAKEEKAAKEVIVVVPAEVKDVEPPIVVVVPDDVVVVADVEEAATVAVLAAGESLEVVDACNGEDDDDVVMIEQEQQETTLTSLTTEPEALPEVDIYDDIVESEKEQVPVLDVKTMNVAKLREELSLRNLNTKGLKAQLTARLQEALEAEKSASKPVVVSIVAPLAIPVVLPVVLPETEPESGEIEEESKEEPILRIVDPSTIIDTSIDEGPENWEVADDESNSASHTEEKMEQDDVSLDDQKGSKGTYPIIKADMKEEERKLWERRYTLPKNPRLMVFPVAQVNIGGKSGSFDCTLMPLSSLRDYRHLDKREESFEVSLFSEFFNEMLQRDFGFAIYTHLLKQAKMVKNGDKEKESGKTVEEVAAEPATKRRKQSSASGLGESKTVDPLLLLAFTFFDENRAGHITEEHLEDICTSLGLGLTRHEMQKLIRKVTAKSLVQYRKWTDKTEAEIAAESQEAEDESLLAEQDETSFVDKIAKGNKGLLPIFTYSAPVVNFDGSSGLFEEEEEKKESILVDVDGLLVDVREIKQQMERADKDRLSAVANSNVFKASLTEAKNQASEYRRSHESVSEELKKAKESLKKLEASDKSQREDLETFKKATERFNERVRDLVKFPIPKSDKKEKEAEPEKDQDDKK